MDIQNVGFLAKTLSLASPRPAELRTAYQRLSARGSVTITCAAAELPSTLAAAEEAGFFGMRVEGTTLTAHKGKEGPCYDTGRRARYRGSAAAVMDDDHHLLSGTLRVCEKTARLYSSGAYQGRIEVTEADGALLARLEKDPAPFDCDTFEADARSLAASLSAARPADGERVEVFYPGPFRLLILTDGTMVRRGRLLKLPLAQARELEERDGARVGPQDFPAPAANPPDYRDLYRQEGAACLLGELAKDSGPAKAADLDALDELPEAMKRRLQTVIARGEEYFILTGSDPAQKDGCCPSNDVGVANHLVEAGILQSRGAGSNSDCPVTLYAFASEIRPGGPKPCYVRNDALRAAVRGRFEKGPRLSRKAALRLALLALFVAASFTLAIALYRQVRGH
jgi:hypothetical protein